MLSESTAEIDATDKLDQYQTIAELKEYVLIDSRKRSIRIYRRNGRDLTTSPPTISGNVVLYSLDSKVISLDDIDEDVDFRRTESAALGA